LAPDAGSSRGRSDLRTRIASALILIAVAAAALAAGGWAFAAVVLLFALVAYREWTSITAVTGSRTQRTGWSAVGLVYVLLPAAALLSLRQTEPSGWAAILFVLIVVWATDTAAYFGGRSIGGPKLWPKVSPKKTWSGAICGFVVAMLAGGAAAALTSGGDFRTGALLAAPLSIAAQAGDLLESAVKRHFGVKDSGSIIPGHGGVLDRVDGLFGAAVIAWLIAALKLGGSILVLPAHSAAAAGGGA
jgi:phosphatidate cytidylyltransferase